MLSKDGTSVKLSSQKKLKEKKGIQILIDETKYRESLSHIPVITYGWHCFSLGQVSNPTNIGLLLTGLFRVRLYLEWMKFFEFSLIFVGCKDKNE